MKILVLGRNPSLRNQDRRRPFIGTASWVRLNDWLKQLGLENYDLANAFEDYEPVINKLTIANSANRLKARGHKRILVLGNDAEKVAKYAGIKYFKLPHPSGRNIKLNDQQFVESELAKCKEWLSA